MRFKRTSKRIVCGLMSALMLLGNAMSGLTAYAVGPTAPVNPDGTTPNGNKPQDTAYSEGTYINDTPLRLQVSKVKTAQGGHEGIAPDNTDAEQADTITYQLSGRVDGSESELIGQYGEDNIELAYSNSGIYLGYGWMKGTLEYLINRQAQALDEEVQIIYNEYGVFAGYGYITRKLETADDVNRYVAGATMTLYDAVEIFRNPEVTTDGDDYREDDRFTGVTVIRDEGSNNVTSVYVNKGYAGTQVMYVLQKDDETLLEVDANGNVINRNYNYQDEINDTGEGTWIAKTIQREDTPILFYSLDNLQITSNDTYVSRGSENEDMINDIFGNDRMEGRLYGFDKEGNVVDITQRDELDFSIYAFEAGTNKPIYEFVGGDFSQIEYDMPEKRIRVGKDTIMYHLDEDGNRDSMVDPQTGIAYIEEEITPPEGHDNIHDVNDTDSTQNTKIFVWPVNVFHDGSGAASGNANGSVTFQKIVTTRIATINADTENEYTTGTLKDGDFVKSMNPVLDQYGHPVYYRQSDETYVKGEDTWDYDGDEYTGFIYHDRLDTENENSYSVNNHDKLYNGDEDDPFDQSTHYQYSTEQSIKVTIDTDGNYIVNGAGVVPTPVRDGYVFGGWLMEPNDLTDGCTLNAWWRNQNNTMDEAEREQWYSDREATGETRTITVKFNANGGEFRSGSGDIHSTDNILYRRLGDAYIMENVWTTGENTPNDPFDTQLVDTVGNTAAGQNTISNTGSTGNDAYSDTTTAGGQADMLKRVNIGTYIMEETKAPAGYSKALPVGITMNENTEIQYAEMVDETIKAEFIKRDAADSFEHDLYIDGVLQANPDGTHITVYEPKGSYSYTHVPGAVLSLKAADDATKQPFSDWVQVTANSDITKKTEDGFYYLEFTTDEPLFLEGIPAGEYIVSEVVTPAGFVTMEDQMITITPEKGVHIFEMNDDHTKVEIEKYYNDGNGNQNLPNAYRAELALADQDGNTVASWKTDDLSDYTNEVVLAQEKGFFESVVDFFAGNDDTEDSFVEQFTSRVNSGNTDFTSISWTVTREAVLSSSSTDDMETWIISDGSRYVCENDTPQADASEAFKQAYATRNQEENTFTYTETMTAEKDESASRNLSDQIWNVSNGTKLHICVYGANDIGSNGRQEYKVDFKFNYRNDYEGEYANLVSYDTLDGYHRFDYLPAGSYTLKEITAPDGFIAAPDQTVVVNETDDVQRFTIENKRRQLEIAKTAEIDGVYFAGMENDSVVTSDDPAHAAVMYGAELTLYYSTAQIPDYEEAFSDGNVPTGVSQADKWISGSDGVYTESDFKKELIREDQIGDYKPHVIEDISNGWYYLVESSTPDYYKTTSVKEIQVTDHTTSGNLTEIQVVNIPMPLEVKVFKRNDAGSPLPGAVFLVKNKTLGGTEVGTLSTGSDGYGKLLITETGRFGEDGAFEPYTFTIQEVSAPAGYQINSEIHEFTIASDNHEDIAIMQNPNDGAIVDGVLYVDDDESAITISKSDFSTGDAVPGTKLSVYEAEYDGNKWQSTGKQSGDDWTWTLAENEMTHTVTGLVAGSVYVIVEEEVPAGYTLADDVFFKVAADGTSIEKIWYDPEENASITFEADSTGAVESVTFSTRTVIGTYVTLEDIESGDVTNMGTLTGGYVNLSASDITDGRHYRMTEHVRYSDGTEDTLSTTTFIAKLYEGLMRVDLSREIDDLTVDITDDSGNSVVSFKPDRTGSYTVLNPLVADTDGLTVTGTLLHKEGLNHEAVQAGDQIRYLISYEGAGKEIVLLPADGLDYIRLDDMQQGVDGNYHYVTEKESGELTIVATVREDAAGYINQQVSIDNKAYSYVNPIAVNHGDGAFANSSKLVISSAVAGTHPENANAAFTFRVTLTKANGAPLDGGYDYRTRYTNGILRAYGSQSEFEITLNGNDFIVIQDLPYNTNYSVVQVVPSDYDFTVENTEPTGKTSETEMSNVLFTNTRNASAERTIFKKNTGYTYSENLNFTDGGDPMILTKYGFSFGEKCEIKDIGILNKPTEVWFSKTDWTDSEEVPGAHCVLMDEDGNVIYDELGNPVEWISGDEPKIFKGVLEAGKTYRYHEEKAPDGYGYSEDVVFTVSEDGTIDKVIMQDKPTRVWFTKEDFAGTEIPGAQVELKAVNEDGTVTTIDSWVSGTEPHEIEGVLTGGKTYIYHEAQAPEGYLYSEDIMFTLDNDGRVIDAHYINADGETLLYDKDGYVTTIIKHEDGSYTDGDVIIHIDGSGNAVDDSGNIHAEGVKEQIEIIDNVIQMKDAPTDVLIKKKDLHTGESLAGATLQLYKGPKKDPYASYDPADKIAEWTTDDSGIFRLEGKLTPGETYTLRESQTIDGYYYSYDVEFTVQDTRDEQVVEMYNRKIVVEVPPDELPPDEEEPDGTNPDYEMEKERVTDAPEKEGTDKFGFYHGDVVTYDVTIKNTGSTRLTMNVTDSFENPEYFSQPVIRAIRYYVNDTDRMNSQMGQTHSINGSVANITIERGGYAVVTYEAIVLDTAPENLASTAPDNGEGYLNTAVTYDVVGKYYEYSGEDHDGDGKGDEVTEVEITDHPNLEDKEDDANTPVQEPKCEKPRYTMSKSRPTPAPQKAGTDRYGFFRGDTVTYEVRVRNTGNMPLKAYVTDEFEESIRQYFSEPVIAGISGGEDISESGMGVGYQMARIRMMPGEEVVITYQATVSMEAPEYLAFMPADDGNGYLNIAKTYDVTAEKSDGTEGGSDEYPGIEDQEDEANTPVQTDEEVPPPEKPEEPDDTNPDYEMEKERVPDAPAKGNTGKFGFYPGDIVTYDVTIRNTGSTKLTMNVTDSFEKPEYFSQPVVQSVRFYSSETEAINTQMGQIHSINGPVANITIERGGYAVVTYEATVLEETPENLAGTAPDNGEGYLNTARTYDVIGKYYEYSGEDHDGDGKGDEITEVEITDHPNLEDKEDDANTPVQDSECEIPRYVMSKSRPTLAPEKEGTGHYGFHRGDTVTYEVRVRNTGNMPLKAYVTDEFDFSIRQYFSEPVITGISGGEDISGSGMGIGHQTARIRIMPGEEVIITFQATVSEDAPERLSFMPSDDGNGYLNIAKVFNVTAEKSDGTEGGDEEYPGIKDQEDDGYTPVQTDDETPPDFPPGPGEETYPIIWLLKTGVDDPSHILAGGTFQVLDEEGNVVLEISDEGEDGFGIGYDWKQWTGVLKADETYYLHEVTPPDGYTQAKEDVKFTVGHYGEKVEAIVTNERIPDYQFTKEDFAGVEIPGASCELIEIKPDGTTETVGEWISDGTPKSFEGELKVDTTYQYREELAPEGYGYSETIEFTLDEDGKITEVHYINEDGEPILYDGDGFPTTIIVHEDGTYTNGDHTITIDENGNAVDENGEIHAEGVRFEIEVIDNVIKMKDAPTEVLLVKTNTDGEILTGGQFQILEKDGTPVKAIKDTLIPSTEHDGNILAGELLIFEAAASGINYTGQLKSGTEYILHELEAPTGHYDSEDVTFYVPYLNQKAPVRVTMEDQPTEVWFTKTDWTTTEEVPGATCILTDEDGNVVIDKDGNRCEWVSGDTPKIFKGSLEPGKTYHYHEEKAPDGYGYSEDIVFTVNLDGTIQKVEMQDKPTEVLITKYSVGPDGNEENATPVEGAVLQIFKENGEPAKALYDSEPDKEGNVAFTKGDEMIFTSTKEGVNITKQLNADETYILRELTPPAGHKKAEDVKFTVSHDGSLIRVNMYDPQTVVKILKTDEAGNAVIGANLEVRDAVNGDLMAEWTTDGTPKVLTGILDAGKAYQLIEANQPDGYYKADPVTFTVSETDEVTEVTMVDEPVEIKLVKVKMNTEERLSGGKFSVIRKSDNETVIPEFVLDGEMTVTGKLNAGETYLFHEIEAPEGYLKSGDVEFTIPLEKPDTIIEVVMENRKPSGGGGGDDDDDGPDGGHSGSTPPSVSIKKYDGVTMQALPGAEFTFYDSNGNVVTTATTNSNGYAYVTFNTTGTFTYKETKAPDGYEISDEVHTIEITRTSHLTENVPNYDNPPDVNITKKDAETGEVISGVRFEITNENGEVVYTGTTDSYGQVIFSPDEYGAYAVRETSVPDGYEKSDGYITFTVTEAGVEGETTFYNTKVGVPPLPNPGKRGEITAQYDNGADGYGNGWFDRDGNWHPFANPLKTGDLFPFAVMIGIAVAGAAGLAVTKKGGKKKHEEE